MTKISPAVEKFNQLLHYYNRRVVKEVLKSYMKSSYFSHGDHDYCHLNEDIVSYTVKYEHKWPDMKNLPGDEKRQYIYVYTKSGKEYHLSARNVKKYIRRMRKLI